MRAPSTLPCLAALLLLATAAPADDFHLKDGTFVTGRLAIEDKHYFAIVDKHRKYLIKKTDVAKHVRKKSFMEEYEERLDALPVDDAEAIFEFARWLEANDWKERARLAYEEVLRIDPDHRDARLALGYARYEGEWVSPDEVKRREGLVEFHGQWYTKHDLAQLKREIEKNEGLRLALEEQQRLYAEVNEIVKGFATFDPKERKGTHRKLLDLANRVDSPELRQFADDALDYFDERAKFLCNRMKTRTEVQATFTLLTMPIASFQTQLGAIASPRPLAIAVSVQAPVTIQLPELNIFETATTVEIPAGCN